MNRLALTTAITLIATPLMAQSQSNTAPAADASRAAVEANFLGLDVNGDKLVQRSEFTPVVAEAFKSFDANNSGDVDQEEFLDSPFGFSDMARVRNRSQAYDAAFGLVFNLFDRDNDGLLNEGDFTISLDRSFTYADVNGDNALNRQEYLRGMITNVALRMSMRE